jgi:hypothetical protein
MSNRFVVKHVASAFAFLLTAAVAGGCKGSPKAGEACSAPEGACVDSTSMMACINGRFASMPCRGAAGCKTASSASDCDNSIASAGDPCDEPGDYACVLDKTTALTCREGKFVVEETCKGAGGCALRKDGLTCDNDISDPGDPCHAVGDYACTTDKKLALTCSDGHVMVPLNSCKGAKGCRVVEHADEKKTEFLCDDAVADALDPCDEDGEEACAMDRKGLLKCKDHKFAPEKACSRGCSFDEAGSKFECDDGASAAAGPTKHAAKKGR